jgi:hypothetical protein
MAAGQSIKMGCKFVLLVVQKMLPASLRSAATLAMGPFLQHSCSILAAVKQNPRDNRALQMSYKDVSNL